MRRSAALTVTLAVLAAACGSREQQTAVARRPDVLLVTIDTLRADRATAALMPAFRALASRGTRFTAARTVAPLTLPAHTSLMTGLYPPQHGVRLNGVQGVAPGVPTLAQAFEKAGYDTAAFVGAFVLDRRFGLSAGFASYDDRIPRKREATDVLEAERRGDAVADAALTWLTGAARSSDRPVFLWVHLYDPHAPYDPPGDARARADGDAYGGEVVFADAQLGRLMEGMKAAGRDPLVAVAGDHGESLGEHGEPGHGMLLYEGAVRIPLVVAGPGVARGERAGPVSLVDVAPTLLARAGLPPFAGIDGQDLLADAPGDREVYGETEYPRAAGWSPLAMLANARWKLIEAPAPELYDMASDGQDAHNRASDRPRDVAGMRQRLSAIRSRSAPASTGAVPADVARNLRALGYVAPSPSVPLPADAPNPASMMRDWAAFEDALVRQANGDRDGAVASFAALARTHPASALIVTTWGRALAAAGRHREAVKVFRDAQARWPDDSALAHDFAVSARASGLAADALAAERKALQIDPDNPLAHNGLGLLLVDAGDLPGARAAFERAASIDPTNPGYQVHLGNAAREAGDAAAAERAYRAALALDADSVDALNGLSVVLVQGGRARDALPLLEHALAVEPGFVDGRLNLGIARQESGDLAGARAAYEAVLRSPARFGRQQATARQLLAALP